MFKLVDRITGLCWPVTVRVPVNGGKVEEQEFTAVFNLLSQDEYEQALQSAKDDAEFISKFMTNWEGLVDDQGKEVKFTVAKLRKACGYPFFRQAIIKAYNEAVQGAAAKN
ncbi:hypothetical protein JYB87_11830 [Shewanella avicenniae]|uniref:Phage tail assembly chaperone n=1 Tax=Shewanella avicenniae TaxID=2814294 RepID=A0ABX7QNC5_9GAMM|nr:hypothetical protein [Shewanella avicenniae]QSX32456.1 hypothetical protein JYB87_11830 [Shewanella avicenniae]